MKRSFLLLLLPLLLIASSVKAQRFGKDSVACITNLSLYIEDYKLFKQGTGSAESVTNMIKSWRWVFNNCPQATENIYIDGANIIELMIERTKSDAKKKALVDTLMMMYDRRIKYYGKEGFVLGRKGVDLYTKDPARYAEAFPVLKKSIQLEGSASNAAVLVYYFRIAVKMLRADKISKSELVDIYDKLTTIIEDNLKRGGNTAFENAQRNIELTFEPYASCTDLVGIYQQKFDAAPFDPINLKKIINLLDKKNCTESDLFFNATIQLNKVEPSAESSYLIGKMYVRKNDHTKAIEYLQKGTKVSDLSDRADCYLLLANANFSLKNFAQARDAAKEAASLRQGDGRPFLLMGDMYAASADACGDNKLTKRVAYWAAVDKYYKAKSVDPKLEKDANEKIATYSRYFPPLEDIFFYELQEGQSYTVGCWINESTTVRALKQ